MADVSTGPSLITPTDSIKSSDSSTIPDLDVIDEIDFRRYVFTGYKITVNLPLVKANKNSIFAINTDGFIPSYIFANGAIGQTYKNLSPVQVMNGALAYVKVVQEQVMLPIQTMYLSNRYVAGSVGVGLRVTSNTGQSGNLMVSQATSCLRQFYRKTEIFNGLRFLNQSTFAIDYTPGNFALIDVSLNRQVSIRPTRRDPLKYTDLAQKIYHITNDTTQWMSTDSLSNARSSNCFASQFLEDWLLFTPLSNFPNQNANQLVIDVFFDYSTVVFLVPIYPVISSIPDTISKNTLDVSATLAVTANPNKANFVWLSVHSNAEEIEEEPIEEQVANLTVSSDV
jgi:hypothetical protein